MILLTLLTICSRACWVKRHSAKYAASMYSVDTTKRFDKDLKRCLKRGLDMQQLYDTQGSGIIGYLVIILFCADKFLI